MRRWLWNDGWSPLLVVVGLVVAISAVAAGVWWTVVAMLILVAGQLLQLTPWARRRYGRRPDHKRPDDFQ